MKIVSFIILSLIPVALMEITETADDDNDRIKRSGFGPIGGVLQNLQKSAFSASAGLSSGSANSVAGLSSSSSGSSSGSGHETNAHSHSYGDDSYGDHQDTKQFDGASLKKSILNTLLQAVKAIAGGVTTLKGQLIKSSGYLVTQKGKLIQAGGDSVSNAGKNIIANSHLVKPDHGQGGASFGHSLGGSFGGLTKTISGLSAGSSGSITSLSGSSSGSSSSPHSSSGSGSVGGHVVAGHDVHGEYAAVDDHGYNSFDNYDAKPVSHESYGPPKSHTQYLEPHAIYGTPEFNDLQGGTMDVLGEILKNIPHKPMKTAISSHSHSFQQIPFPNSPPPFKPLNDYQSPPSLNSLHAEYGVPHQEYGMPLVYSHEYMSSLSSNKQSVMVDPKAYDAYHSMKNRKINPQHNSLRSQSTLSSSLPGLDHLKAPYEIQKSIEYEIHSR